MSFWHCSRVFRQLNGARFSFDANTGALFPCVRLISPSPRLFHACPPEGVGSDVIVVGAGPAGLTLASLLARFGVSVTVLEKQHELTTHPQAHFINHRSMEVFRGLDGLAERIVEASPPLEYWRKFVYCESVIGKVLGDVDHFAGQQTALKGDLSPEPVTHFSQHRLVPLLYDSAVQAGARVLFEKQVVGISDRDRDGVEVSVEAKGKGGVGPENVTLECKYLILCDGANSPLRSRLGISMVGEPSIQHLINVHFLSKSLASRMKTNPAMLYFVLSSDVVLVLVVHCLKSGEFVAQIPYFPPLQVPSEFDGQKCQELINRGAGFDVHDLEIVSVRPWTMRAQVADRFSRGRAFLVGDSAHVFPPAGGFGMNTGVQDAHNLAWKLASVLKGGSGREILDTYETERRPIAVSNAELSVRNWNEASEVPSAIGLNPSHADLLRKISSDVVGAVFPERIAKSFLELGLVSGRKLSGLRGPLKNVRQGALSRLFESGETLRLQFPREDLGFSYTSMDPGCSEHPVQAEAPSRSAELEPSVRIGYRLPHCFFERELFEGKTTAKKTILSSIDLVSMAGVCFVLFCSKGSIWPSKLSEFSEEHLPLVLVQVTPRAPSRNSSINDYVSHSESMVKDWRVAMNARVDVVDFSGKWGRLACGCAVLVRPDGHVVWLEAAGAEGSQIQDMLSRLKWAACL
ncbi:hypothetical protein BSKO_09321 [Bryopsis sp. KO-2023]|nr:hypothetical protein BSKO_09321 [Bryopsis sp. KO-2023]